jgi:polar amino acid transport system substrate-binding protein
MGVAVRKDEATIKKPEDIAGKVVAVVQASGQLAALKVYDEELKKTKGSGVKEIKEYVGYPEAYSDLGTGRVEAVINSVPNLAYLAKQQPEKYRVVGTFGERAYFGWVTRLEDKDLLKYLNDRLIKLKEQGVLKELQQKWFGYLMETPNFDYQPLRTK